MRDHACVRSRMIDFRPYESLLLSFLRSQAGSLATASRGSRLRFRGARSRPSEGKAMNKSIGACSRTHLRVREGRAFAPFVIIMSHRRTASSRQKAASAANEQQKLLIMYKVRGRQRTLSFLLTRPRTSCMCYTTKIRIQTDIIDE